MEVTLAPGKYVVAVSGGVDSMVLLDMLVQLPGLELTVAHFEHGIREDSDQDRRLVEAAAAHYGLPFIYERGKLGAHASEATARQARYAFLRRVRQQAGAKAIITAHHQDDLIETAIINILRGTGRKGLSSLASTDQILRPLLNVTKREILDYAARHPGIKWREDSTNEDERYLRNYIRHKLVPRLSPADRTLFLKHLQDASATNPHIDELMRDSLARHVRGGTLSRRWFVMLPYDVSCEAMAAWLRSAGIHEFDRKLVERLVVGAKVAAAGKLLDINAENLLEVGKDGLQIRHRFLSRQTV